MRDSVAWSAAAAELKVSAILSLRILTANVFGSKNQAKNNPYLVDLLFVILGMLFQLLSKENEILSGDWWCYL